MANVNFHSQLASVMEVLANAAVAEICQLVDDGYAVLRLEISRTQRENLALKSKLRLMEVRSRDRFPRRSPVPHLVVSCGKKAHGAVKHSSCAKKTTGDLGPHPSSASQVVSSGQPQVAMVKEPLVVMVKEEDLGDGDHQMSIGVSHASSQNVEPASATDHRRPNVRPPPPYRPASPPTPYRPASPPAPYRPASPPCDPAQRAVEEAGAGAGVGAGVGDGAALRPGDRHGALGQPLYGPAPPLEHVEPGRVDLPCSFPAEEQEEQEEAGGSFGTGTVPPQASLDWKVEALVEGGTLKMEAAGGGAWAQAGGGAYEASLSLVPAAPVGMETTEEAAGGSQARGGAACEDSAESRSSEMEGGAFDTSFEELFSSADLGGGAGGGGGGEGVPLYLFPTSGGAGGRLLPERVLHCEQCGRLFHNARDLVVHQRSHAGERLFHCPQCKKPFLHLHQLQTHQRVHTGEKPFSCSLCGRRFSQSSHIKRHMSVHTGEKRYACSLCGKRFSQACSLKVHQSVHTGERPYSCTQCGKSFSVLGNLVRHQSVHFRK